MAQVNIDSFVGVDRRRTRGSGDPGRMWTGENVFITKGSEIERRPPMRFEYACSDAILGLAHAGGKLHGWHGLAAGSEPDAADYPHADVFTLHNVHEAGKILQDVLFAQILTAVSDDSDTVMEPSMVTVTVEDPKMYSVVRYTDGTIQHWYGTDKVTDESCPQSFPVAIAGGRVFAVDGDVLRFSKVAEPTDWTGIDDAGFLPVGQRSEGRGTPTALGSFKDTLVVFYEDLVQTWYVPATLRNHRFVESLGGVGCVHPHTVVTVEDSVFFLGAGGYRSVAAEPLSGRARLVQVGQPVDKLVQDPARPKASEQRAVYAQGLGQYVNLRIGRNADVFAFSRQPPVAGWSTYTFQSPVAYPVAAGSKLWMRNQDTGAIVSLDIEQTFEPDSRDQTGQRVSRDSRIERANDVADVFPTRSPVDTADGTAYADGSTTTDGQGPSADTNTSPFVAWGVYVEEDAQPRLVVADSYARPRGLPEPVEVEVEYSAQGAFTADDGAWLQADVSGAGSNVPVWETFLHLPGWEYAPDRREGDLVVDAVEGEFFVSRDGGWRSIRGASPPGTKGVRMVIGAGVDPSGDIAALAWDRPTRRTRLAYGSVDPRPQVPARLPTNLSPDLVFVAHGAHPAFYVPSVALGEGGDVAVRTASATESVPDDAQQTYEHQVAHAGDWSAAGSAATVIDLDDIETQDQLVFEAAGDWLAADETGTVGNANGQYWYETYARSVSATIDKGRNELLVVSGNGRAIKLAAGATPAMVRVRVWRYRYYDDISGSSDVRLQANGGTHGTRITGDLLIELPLPAGTTRTDAARHAHAGQYYLAVDEDGDANRMYVADLAQGVVHEITRPPAYDQPPAHEGSFDFPRDLPVVSGIAASAGSVYVASYPQRHISRYSVAHETWFTYVIDTAPEMQSQSLLCFRDGKLYLFDAVSRTIHGWEPISLPEAGDAVAVHEFAMRYIKVTSNPAVRFVSRVLMALHSAGGQGRQKLWHGARFESEGRAKVRWAYRARRKRIEHTEYDVIDGDTTADGMLPIGVSSPEIGAEFLIDTDLPWRLDSINIEQAPLSIWGLA